jgi:hypothetical protein
MVGKDGSAQDHAYANVCAIDCVSIERRTRGVKAMRRAARAGERFFVVAPWFDRGADRGQNGRLVEQRVLARRRLE